jgi:hypothetical protein
MGQYTVVSATKLFSRYTVNTILSGAKFWVSERHLMETGSVMCMYHLVFVYVYRTIATLFYGIIYCINSLLFSSTDNISAMKQCLSSERMTFCINIVSV